MKIEIVPEYFIHVTADEGKMLTNGEVVAKEIFAPLDSDISMWIEIDEEQDNININIE